MNANDLAKKLWNYHYLDQNIQKADCIVALGNSDIRTAQKAAELFNQGFGEILVVTGGFGRLTAGNFKSPEAHIFAEEAVRLGVPRDKILIEDKSTNTFDNIRFTKKILSESSYSPGSYLVVTKPYMERRAYETFLSVWPDVPVQVASPDLDFENYPNDAVTSDLLINMLVGDQQRLMIFSDSGNVATQDVPDEVMSAYLQLIELGYTQQLIPDENIKDLLEAVKAGGR